MGIGETAHQLVLETKLRPAPQVVGRRRTDREHPQLAGGLDGGPVPISRGLLVPGVEFGQVAVEEAPELRVLRPQRPADTPHVRQFAQLPDRGTRPERDAGGGLVHDRRLEGAGLDEVLDRPVVGVVRHGHPGRVRVVGREAFLVGPRQHAEDPLGAADHPLAGNRQRDGERHPVPAGLGLGQRRHGHVGAAFLEREEQPLDVALDDPLRPEGVAVREPFGQQAIALLGKPL